MVVKNCCRPSLLIVVHVLVWRFAAATSRPHIILIVADDLGYNDVSFHGSNQIPTPNIDNLAYGGIILNNYYVSPICTPTRGALMTGRHPIQTGLQSGVIVASQPYGLPLNETIMPQHFKRLGYRRHMVGKWHLGFHKREFTPLYRGFESHYGYYLGCGDYYDHTSEANEEYFGFDFWRNSTVDFSGIGQYSTDLFRQEANTIIQKHDTSEPLFLYLPFQAVHSGNLPSGKNLQAPTKYIKKFTHIQNKERQTYAAMVSALDDAVGSIVQTLKDRKMYSNSIIVFTTDNGGPANGFDGNAASNFPLRGVKATLWEGGVRGVGFVSSPLLKTKGYTSNQLIHVTDWLPTLYTAAGGRAGDLKKLYGVDQWQVLQTNGKPVRDEMLHNIDPLGKSGAIRVGEYKLIYGHVMGWDGWYPPYQLPENSKSQNIYTATLENSQHHNSTKLEQEMEVGHRSLDRGTPVTVQCGSKPANASTNCQANKVPCLYHILSDPCEYNNIAADHMDIVSKLMDKIKEYRITMMVPPGNKPADPAGNPRLHGGIWKPWLD
ncbi:arylsulfatase B-like [Ostrea edulis]|uniref:arylsulfatase B-like n=1 Tax=Ostrea edulis TaxID=37623 RepID=UPI002096539A|nr:arylsulfatase B-like [Ostrea edulis]XP_048729624.1 arylsulfatase B-like [Ostrea edulis]